MKKLKDKLIDSRPFFYPISMFPMYEEQNTPNAHFIGSRGINLPSGLQLTKHEVNYISDVIIELLS
jgi:perosamine synthetase